MKAKYDTIEEFIKEVMTEDRVRIVREKTPSYKTKPEGEFSVYEFETLVSEIGRYDEWDDVDNPPPFEVPLFEGDHDTDHDHGAWTDRYILNVDERFYEVNFDYFGQGDFEGNGVTPAKEVFKKEITRIIYE